MPGSHAVNLELFLTPAEVASALGVSPNTVTRWAREGRVPFQMTLGGHRRFEAQVVEALRQRLQEKATQATPLPAGAAASRS
ncbi:MAG: excisionase family DNA-binding protein [Thermoanaerobaculia bacterium]|nr:Chromosome-anchoring protein RacA [Thermoanaerobaculia bacterium]MCK6681756.1 excisionase family DNA-binding protein [Thermoanaerobaculia bacterium]